jgi:hypothetical protein
MIKKEILSFSCATGRSFGGFFVVSVHVDTPN